MMLISFCHFAWPHICIFFLLMLNNFTFSTSKSVPYSKACASVVPEASATTYADFTFPYLESSTTYFTGGERILSKSSSPHTFGKFQNFHTSRSVYATNTNGVYKIEAELTFRVYNFNLSNSTYSSSSRGRRRRLKFLLHGFWSESSGKGCLVGSASWYSNKGDPLNLQAMFNMNYSRNSTYSNSFIAGKLESLSPLNDESYFEPISILSFPQVNQYDYKLLSEETIRGFHVVNDVRKAPVLHLQPGETCSYLKDPYTTYRLEYGSSCNGSPKNCSWLDGVLGYRPSHIALYSFQCEELRDKMRVLVKFTNTSYVGRYGILDPNATLVGEGIWDDKMNWLAIVGCRILSSNSVEDAHVRDCSFRLNLWYPSVWSIRNRISAMGQLWTNKTAGDVGYLDKITLSTSDEYLKVPGLKYEYTEMDNVNKVCPKKVVTKGKGYPSGQSYDMRFDMSVQNTKFFGWSSAEPIFIGNELYAYAPQIISDSRWGGSAEIIDSEAESGKTVLDNVPLNVSYRLIFSSMGISKLGAVHSSLNASLDSYGQLEISAEGVYDAQTGYLCMVGCRNLGSYNSQDCDILLNFQFPGSDRHSGGFVKGSMMSIRKKRDPLFFEHLNMTSTSFSSFEAERSLWRIDLEITMVLISNTLACIFVCFQLYHVKRYPNTLPHNSLVMLVILTMGHMIPLVLNFEALFLEKQNKQDTILSASGWLEVNEVVVRVVKMAAFLLQFRLLQLSWTAKNESSDQGISVAEKKTLLVSLPLYIVGGLIAFLVNWKKNYYANSPRIYDYSQVQPQQHTLWGDLRLYAGLILDGFLFPQILLNIFQLSSESALSWPFYLGTTLVRAVPHAYDRYRANNYVPSHVNSTYMYANPGADFYSVAWDIIIPLAGLFLVVIIFLQQKYGGRVILPKQYRELELYAKVPVIPPN